MNLRVEFQGNITLRYIDRVSPLIIRTSVLNADTKLDGAIAIALIILALLLNQPRLKLGGCGQVLGRGLNIEDQNVVLVLLFKSQGALGVGFQDVIRRLKGACNRT